MIIAHRTPSTDARIEANVDAALAFYTLFESDDPNALDRAVAPSWTVDPPAPGAPGTTAGYRPALAAFRAAFPDTVVTVEDAFGAGDRVVVRCTMRATHRAPFLNVPGTGKPIALRTSDVHRIDNGRIVESWHIEDLLGFLVQAGAVDPGA